MDRLARICFSKPYTDDFGYLWHKGLMVIQRKYGVTIYLSRFEPANMIEGECPSTEVTITPYPTTATRQADSSMEE
jgi:hypothetical protein